MSISDDSKPHQENFNSEFYFPFSIHQEHRLSEQAVVLAGISLEHNCKAVLKTFDLKEESKAFKKELEVLGKIQLQNQINTPKSLPELLGFAYSIESQKGVLMISHAGRDLNKEWLYFMDSRKASTSVALKIKVVNMGYQLTDALKELHNVGFCHWDLKLDNICFNEGRYYLIDFAFSQRIRRSYPITSFKGNSMFASIRKFRMNPRAHPIDDIESLLYLICFCLDGFYLPWLQDYINHPCTDQFIQVRKQKARKSREYLYETMPDPISKALRYVQRLNEKIYTEEQELFLNEDNQSFQFSHLQKKSIFQVDYDFLKKCLTDLLNHYQRQEYSGKIVSENSDRSGGSCSDSQNSLEDRLLDNENQQRLGDAFVQSNQSKKQLMLPKNIQTEFKVLKPKNDKLLHFKQLKLQYALKIALFNFALDSLRHQQEAETMNAPRGQPKQQALVAKSNVSLKKSFSQEQISFKEKIANFFYSSANVNDIEKLRYLYFELETVDFNADNRHDKFNDWEDLDLGDDCDEQTDQIDTSRNLAMKTNDLKILTENQLDQKIQHQKGNSGQQSFQLVRDVKMQS